MSLIIVFADFGQSLNLSNSVYGVTCLEHQKPQFRNAQYVCKGKFSESFPGMAPKHIPVENIFQHLDDR